MTIDDSWTNFYSGSPLNRFAWLRHSSPFLNHTISNPSTRWIIFNDNSILVTVATDAHSDVTSKETEKEKVTALGYLRTEDIRDVLGEEPYFGFGNEREPESGTSRKSAENDPLAGARLQGPTAVFLGILEPGGANEASLPTVHDHDHGHDSTTDVNDYGIKGTPYFAIDFAQVPIADRLGQGLERDRIDEILANSGKAVGKKFKLVDFRIATGVFGQVESSLFAQARSIIDWNARNKFCPGCGTKQYSLWGGWKLACRSTLGSADLPTASANEACLSSNGLHNFAFPRTDPVIIIAVLSEDGSKILLGRGKRYPPNLYSTIGGFVESGESFEDAVKREIWEECGLRVWNVRYHSSQPWPYPANLMVGYYCTANSQARVRTDLDNELVDAKWYTKGEVQAVLAHSGGAVITKKENPWFEAGKDEPHDHGSGKEPAALSATIITTTTSTDQGDSQPAFRVPPRTAVGGVLISDWAFDRV
ncbi:hypothetical protein AX16_010328 [Volvariella volvacea WC 439]|nr:hypothetical protein AX16_010328 [Volvariella volvacea WC 439]